MRLSNSRLLHRTAMLTLALLPALAAQAADQPPSKGERQAEAWFQMLDRNKDGHLSRAEVQHIAPLIRDFEAADTDRNGLVSRAEIRRLSEQRKAERRARKAAAAAAAKPASAP